jgi:hypothetical protein
MEDRRVPDSASARAVGEAVVVPSDHSTISDQRRGAPNYLGGFSEGIEAARDRRPGALRLRRVHQREGENDLYEGETKSGTPDARGGGSPRGQRE